MERRSLIPGLKRKINEQGKKKERIMISEFDLHDPFPLKKKVELDSTTKYE